MHMKIRDKKYNIKHEIKRLVYMLIMVFSILLADMAVVYAASDDDGAEAEHYLDRNETEENRTAINEPGSAETREDLQELNIANTWTITYDGGNGELNGMLRILIVLTAIAVLPILLITLTSFTRILIVLHFTRQALNTQSAPPNQVLIAIALFLTFYIMQPVFADIYTNALVPYDSGEITTSEALDAAVEPLREFMLGEALVRDIDVFMQLSDTPWDGENMDLVPTTVLIPAFIIGELRQAFIIGFIIYIPFIVLDMVVASVLMSMGMMMLPPTTISMPFKILLFVLADGWNLVIVELIKTFH